ncbi:P-loop containing nucleoside triphosphate hydrolase protein [Bimuria novae-zelandiae CBS 107.79]|uniref:P-loop containing nucleoside triphosphate hydrolase protein n=1 Tax=Bimuria novae-zelandiae CBS 107.79 TaxID=1447943 RepID=A0A6A5UYU2_9PLEO|nr:P-loop containing nucleoside triphosphate hydrolase protein [Bimuria novae-zelandiae CBS 107.79]
MSQSELDQEEPPDEAFYFLVPLQTKGFNLRAKKWLDLNMDQIHPVVWNQEAFDSLVLDRKTKELITALVSKQISAAKPTDVISGKGNGLILLLHGGPGTGKTLTAEGVAETAQKPLYRVTCGDVGTKAEEVEGYLESVLHLGKIWDCVVLLDEAEVFLECRSLDDLQRNTLVSVFLRVIEYHEGILILTSNRDGTVDVEDLRDHLEELQHIEINGRQIHNAITTARQYAEWKGKVMNYEPLTTALEVPSKFNDYSEKLRGGLTDDQIAEEEGIR